MPWSLMRVPQISDANASSNIASPAVKEFNNYTMYTGTGEQLVKYHPHQKLSGKWNRSNNSWNLTFRTVEIEFFNMYVFIVSQYMKQGNIVNLQFYVSQILGLRDCKYYLYGPSQMPIRTIFLGFYTIPDCTTLLGGSNNNGKLEVCCVSVCKNEVPEAQQNLFRPRAHYKERIKTQVFCTPHTSKQHRSHTHICKAQ